MQHLFLEGNNPPSKLAEHIARELAAYDDVIAIVLFGSVASGRARKSSDIDICIITTKDIPDSTKSDLLSFGSDIIDISLFYDLPITIRFRVIREGKILFSRDTLALHAITADTVREYLNIAPFIRRNSLRSLGITGSPPHG